jgi:hypothetical protein
MPRPAALLLVLTMVVVSGCAGIIGGQDTATPTVEPTSGSTVAPTDTPATTPTETPMSMNDQPYTLFTGSIAGGEARRGSRAFVRENPVTMNISITNNEGQRMNYTTVIQLVRLSGTGSNASIAERRLLDQFTTSLEAGENRTVTRTITPNMTGQNLLLVALLYKSDPSATPTLDTANNYLAVPVNVTGPPQQTNRPSISS